MIGISVSGIMPRDIFQLFKDYNRLLPMVRDFHKDPNIDVFNAVIHSDPICLIDGALQIKYINPKFERLRDNLEDGVYEDETDFVAWGRRKKAKEELEKFPEPEFMPNFCNAFLLAWVNSAVRQFPQLYACDSPMYIEYSQKFTFASFTNWQQLFNRICTGDECDINASIIRDFLCCVAMRYCASGDIVPLEDIFTRAKALNNNIFGKLIRKLIRLFDLPLKH